MAQTTCTSGGFDLQTAVGSDALRQLNEELDAVSNLAALLDSFTASLANPDASSVGQFAGTVQALHSELAMLAGHFRGDGASQDHETDFDDVFPVNVAQAGAVPVLDPAFHGVLAEAELEQLCQNLSR